MPEELIAILEEIWALIYNVLLNICSKLVGKVEDEKAEEV